MQQKNIDYILLCSSVEEENKALTLYQKLGYTSAGYLKGVLNSALWVAQTRLYLYKKL